MRFIAITADSAWRTALQTSKTATVNSVFHGAVNLQIASGELLSIFPALKPNNVVTNTKEKEEKHVIIW